MKKSRYFLIGAIVLLCIFFVAAQGPVVNLKDWVKVQIVSPVEDNGGIPVNIQDQTSPPLDLFFTQLIGSPTTLAQDSFINNITVNVTSASSISVGTYLGIFAGSEADRFYFGEVLNINGNIITLDTPLDFNYTAGSPVIASTRNLNIDGSGTTQIFSIRGSGENSTLEIDITRIMISLETDGPVDLDKFGDLTKLENGIVLRRTNGDTRNIWNVKSNGEIANLCYDYDPHLATNPSQGQNGVNFRYSFAGQDKHGVAVRIGPGESLELLIQDDLTGLESFRIIAEGHIVAN